MVVKTHKKQAHFIYIYYFLIRVIYVLLCHVCCFSSSIHYLAHVSRSFPPTEHVCLIQLPP